MRKRDHRRTSRLALRSSAFLPIALIGPRNRRRAGFPENPQCPWMPIGRGTGLLFLPAHAQELRLPPARPVWASTRSMVPLARGSGSWNRLSSGPNRLPHALNRMLRILNRLHWILNRIIVTYLDVSRFEMTCGNVISLCLHAQIAVGKGRPPCGADPSSESQARKLP